MRIEHLTLLIISCGLIGFKFYDYPIIEPYLLHVSPHSIQIHWEMDPGPSLVRYGKDKMLAHEINVAGEIRKQRVVIEGLEADTPYYYQVENGNRRTDIFSFRTAPLNNRSVTFCVYGDNRIKDTSFRYPHPHAQIINGMIKDQPDFFINTGDIFMTGVDSLLFMEDFFLGARDLIATTPLFLAIGNHEYIGDPLAEATKKYFTFPEDKTWYEAHYGNIQFLFLDSTQLLFTWENEKRLHKNDDEITKDEQYQWLVGRLRQPKSGWRIVVLHHHIFSSGIFGIDTTLVKHLVPLFENSAVDLVLGGHEHNYERSERNGITYLLTGGGGSYLRPVNITANPYQKSAAAEFHHLRIKVDKNHLTGAMVCDVDRNSIPDYSSDYKLDPPKFNAGDIVDQFEQFLRNQ